MLIEVWKLHNKLFNNLLKDFNFNNLLVSILQKDVITIKTVINYLRNIQNLLKTNK